MSPWPVHLIGKFIVSEITSSSPVSARPLTISRLTQEIKRLLEVQIGRVHVEGEISNLTIARSGHAYFNLKDANAQISCVMWASGVSRLSFRPADGLQVEARGEISVYAPRGNYQLIVASMTEAGRGRLWLQFQELKERLEKEGLFAPERKQPIPFLPARIGVITSPTGAAIRDFLNVLGRRFAGMEVLIWPTLVQGEGAAAQIAHALRRFNALANVDVIVVTRGGGSIEDLWAFNEEPVARAIFDSRIPVISAVGHEVDFTIADFVADLRAPTPSAAAEIVVRSRREMAEQVEHLNIRLHRALSRTLERARMRLNVARNSYGMRRPLDRIHQTRQRLDELSLRMDRALQSRMRDTAHHLRRLTEMIEALNPTAILERGYSIVTRQRDGVIVRSADEVDRQDKIDVRTADGSFPARVEKPIAGEQLSFL